MKFVFTFLVLLVANSLAQDTYKCPDGWEKHEPEGGNECKCFLFGEQYASVNHDDAAYLCQGHDAWLAELEDGADDNYWVVNKLWHLHNQFRKFESVPSKENNLGDHTDYGDQFWIGARSYTKHDVHNPGAWIWENLNTSVTWFNWEDGQPNDWHRQQCMTFVRHDFTNGNGDVVDFTYNWNDQDCNDQADYICEKLCAE